MPSRLPEPPPGAAPFLRRLQLVHQFAVALPFHFKLSLQQAHLPLQAANPLLGHRQRRVSSHAVARRAPSSITYTRCLRPRGSLFTGTSPAAMRRFSVDRDSLNSRQASALVSSRMSVNFHHH